MSRAIDADKIEYYSDEMGNEIAYKVDIDKLPTLTPPNEPLTCEGCIYNHNKHDYCDYCVRRSHVSDYYRRPPEGEGNA